MVGENQPVNHRMQFLLLTVTPSGSLNHYRKPCELNIHTFIVLSISGLVLFK